MANRMPRNPTPDEMLSIYEAFLKHPAHGDLSNFEDAAHFLASADIIILPEYITGGPGYAGPVVIVVYDGSPEWITILTRPRDQLHGFEIVMETSDNAAWMYQFAGWTHLNEVTQ